MQQLNSAALRSSVNTISPIPSHKPSTIKDLSRSVISALMKDDTGEV